MMKNVLVRIFLCVLVLLMLVGCAGCGSARAVRPSANAKKVVATAGGVDIYYDEYYYLAMMRKKELMEAHKDAPLSDEELRVQIEAYLQEHLLNKSHALIALGKQYGLDIEKGDLADSVQTHMEAFIEESFGGSRDAYIEGLNEGYLTDRYVRFIVAVENYLSQEIAIKIMQESPVTDEQVYAAVAGEDFMRIRQVVISTKYSTSAEKARAKAEELRANVYAAADRSKAMYEAMAHSMDFSDTGNGIYFARGEMDPDYEAIAFALEKDYDVSEVFEYEGDYYFMMRLPKDDSTYIAENMEIMKSKMCFVVLNQKVDKIYAGMTLEMTEFGKSLDPLKLDAINAGGGEGILAIILVASICAAVLILIFVVRVLWLRHNIKKGKMPRRKKNAQSNKKNVSRFRKGME